MTRDEFNRFCQGLAATTHVVQWGGSDVWKIGGKMFAVCGWSEGEVPGITFKVSPVSFEILKHVAGVRPAPYLASRGLLWMQRHAVGELSDAELRDYLTQSYHLVAAGLSAKRRRELGISESQRTGNAASARRTQ